MTDKKNQTAEIQRQRTNRKSKIKNQKSKHEGQRIKNKEQKAKTKSNIEHRKPKIKSAIRWSQSAIVLLGFMGSGKTTVAKKIAEKFGCDFLDLDSFIESREGRAVASIIDEKGEAHFRAVESKALRDALKKNRAQIIALGGGAWTIEENRKLISKYDCLSVWLDVPFEVCWKRLKTESDVRPFARDKKKAKNLYDSRREIYNLSRIRIDVSQEINAEEIADRIIDEIVIRQKK